MPLKGKKKVATSNKNVAEEDAAETEISEKLNMEDDTNIQGSDDDDSRPSNGAANSEVSEKEDTPPKEEEKLERKEKAKEKGKGKGKKETKSEKKNEEESPKRPSRGSKRILEADDDPSAKRVKLSPDKSFDFSCEKTTSDGKAANLKISAWNVAGLRAWIKKEGSLDYVLHLEQPDMILLLETKCADNKLPPEIKIPDYQMYTVCSEKEGYCGLLLYSKIKPLSVQYGIGNKEFDKEGRCIIAEFKDFYLVCTYVPNAGQGLKTLPKRLKWNTVFLKLLKDLDEKKPIVLCGDLNVAHEPIDLANPKTNTKNAGFTKEERDDFTKLLNEGFVDTFRHLYPDKTGAYTFWSNRGGARDRNVGWRLDYFVISQRFMPHLCDSMIRSHILGSDHCPITLCINV